MPSFEAEQASVDEAFFGRCIYGHVYDVCMFMSTSVCVLPVETGGQSQVPVLDFTLLKTKVLLFSSVTPRVDSLRMLRAFYSSHLT